MPLNRPERINSCTKTEPDCWDSIGARRIRFCHHGVMELTPDGGTAPRIPSPAVGGMRRIGDAEREAISEELTQHFILGRLTQDEFDERLALAIDARVDRDLLVLVADLPRLESPAPPDSSAPTKGAPLGAGRAAVSLVTAVLSGLTVLAILFYAMLTDSPVYIYLGDHFIWWILVAVTAGLTCGISSTVAARAWAGRWLVRPGGDGVRRLDNSGRRDF